MADSAPKPEENDSDDPFVTSMTMLNGAKEGSAAAWQELVERYRPWIVRQCIRSGLSRDDAENISQEVFIDLFQRISNFERSRQGSFRKWLSLISRSRMVDSIRSFAKRKEELADPQQMSQVTKSEDTKTLNALAPTARTMERFEATMERLKKTFKERDIEILVRLATGTQSPKEIAKELGISVNVVYLVKSRMMKQIKEAAEQFPEIEDDQQSTGEQ
ncbi:RNA polymerase sigma factor [Rubinisphaera sp. JC750]|uniref:RNA polymerase sigma factor n=1 Tax=Rubinisphaera sp. JC750 TaxID=2898658 RepID=UPI001F393669|nr:sigma-70 family RNA polymerase sigma factor [Rubinisphaera sp. JC750]